MVDSVRLVPDERLDLPDAQALQALLATGLEDLAGALLGKVDGCTSPWAGTLTDDGAGTYYLNLGAFQFLQSTPTLTDDGGVTYKACQTKIVTHDPTLGSQVSAVDYTAARVAAIASDAANAYPYLYAKPYLIAADTAARKKFSGGAQVSASIQTRYRQRVQFKFDASAPAANIGWAVVGKVYAWPTYGAADPGLPEIYPTLWTDSGDRSLNAGAPGNWYDPTAPGIAGTALALTALTPIAGYDMDQGTSRDAGLGQMLSLIFSRLRLHVASDDTAAWYEAPAVDLKTAKAALDALEATPIPWGVASISDSALVTGKNVTAAVIGGQYFRLTLNPAPSFAYTIIAVQYVGAMVSALGVPLPSVSYLGWTSPGAGQVDVRVKDELANWVLPLQADVVIWIKRT